MKLLNENINDGEKKSKTMSFISNGQQQETGLGYAAAIDYKAFVMIVTRVSV